MKKFILFSGFIIYSCYSFSQIVECATTMTIEEKESLLELRKHRPLQIQSAMAGTALGIGYFEVKVGSTLEIN